MVAEAVIMTGLDPPPPPEIPVKSSPKNPDSTPRKIF
jgi:hypothetical protein